jgi:hypothetical protein
MHASESGEETSQSQTGDLMNWIAMTIVNAPPEQRGDRVVIVRHNLEASIKRFGLQGEEAEAWLLKSMTKLRGLVEDIETDHAGAAAAAGKSDRLKSGNA